VSLTCDDDILLGAVFEPYSDRLFFAAKGEGATMNGRPIHVSGRSELQDAVVALSRHTSFLRQGEAAGRAFHDLLDAVEVRITSSTALDMCCVANGSIEGRVMANTRVWDNSAATLLVREAGGMVTDWDGGAALPSSRKLVASNGLCHQAILALLRNGGEKR
jgi:myo-inositol-1(or 4)-monophosphatase